MCVKVLGWWCSDTTGVDTHPASVSRCCKPQSCLSSSLSQQFCISETASNSTYRGKEGKPSWTTKKTLSIELKSIPSGHINMEGGRSLLSMLQPSSTWGTDLRVPPDSFQHCRATESAKRGTESIPSYPSVWNPLKAGEDTQRLWEATSKGQGKSTVKLLRFSFCGGN